MGGFADLPNNYFLPLVRLIASTPSTRRNWFKLRKLHHYLYFFPSFSNKMVCWFLFIFLLTVSPSERRVLAVLLPSPPPRRHLSSFTIFRYAFPLYYAPHLLCQGSSFLSSGKDITHFFSSLVLFNGHSFFPWENWSLISWYFKPFLYPLLCLRELCVFRQQIISEMLERCKLCSGWRHRVWFVPGIHIGCLLKMNLSKIGWNVWPPVCDQASDWVA